MPVHDWSKMEPGEFHDFHQGWTVALKAALNHGVLPKGYSAYVERYAGKFSPDVLTLHSAGQKGDSFDEPIPGVLAVATAPPQVQTTVELERNVYEFRKNIVTVYHVGTKRVIAMIELVSAGNKASNREFRRFLDKSLDVIDRGVHLLIIDLYPPTSRDPEGIHGAIWSELGDDTYRAPAEKSLTLASYCAGEIPKAFVEPIAVGDELPLMPLFINQDQYVNVPLARTYDEALQWSADELITALQHTLIK